MKTCITVQCRECQPMIFRKTTFCRISNFQENCLNELWNSVSETNYGNKIQRIILSRDSQYDVRNITFDIFNDIVVSLIISNVIWNNMQNERHAYSYKPRLSHNIAWNHLQTTTTLKSETCRVSIFVDLSIQMKVLSFSL